MTTAMHPDTLRNAVADLIRIQDAGGLRNLNEELQYEFAHSSEPIGTTWTDPIRKWMLDDVVTMVHSTLDAPLDDCRKAVEAHYGSARQTIVLNVIADFIHDLDGTVEATTTATGIPAAIERARKVG